MSWKMIRVSEVREEHPETWSVRVLFRGPHGEESRFFKMRQKFEPTARDIGAEVARFIRAKATESRAAIGMPPVPLHQAPPAFGLWGKLWYALKALFTFWRL